MSRTSVATFLVMMIFLAGFVAGVMRADSRWQEKSIQAGFGEYDRETGKWQWKQFRIPDNTEKSE